MTTMSGAISSSSGTGTMCNAAGEIIMMIFIIITISVIGSSTASGGGGTAVGHS